MQVRCALHSAIFNEWRKENEAIAAMYESQYQLANAVNKKVDSIRGLATRDKGQLVGEGISSKEMKWLQDCKQKITTKPKIR